MKLNLRAQSPNKNTKLSIAICVREIQYLGTDFEFPSWAYYIFKLKIIRGQEIPIHINKKIYNTGVREKYETQAREMLYNSITARGTDRATLPRNLIKSYYKQMLIRQLSFIKLNIKL